MNLSPDKPQERETALTRFRKFPLGLKIFSGILVIALIWFGWTRTHSTAATPQYQTAAVTRDTLIVSTTVSGQVASTNNVQITTQASGVVSHIYAKDGDTVKAGQKLADIELDLTGQQKNTQAWATYQSAQNNLASAKASLFSTQSTMFTKWNTYLNLAQNGTYQNGDGSPNTQNRDAAQFISTNDDWLAAEALYKNAQAQVAQSETALSSAWFTYQQSAPSIIAPLSGKLTGFSLQEGSVITAQTTTNGVAANQRVASITTEAAPTITLNLTQIDAPNVKVGNNATVTFDAFTGKTFTGKVVSIDTVGITSSGVTTYPATILLDTTPQGILPNMSASANIITQTKNNVLLVPTSAVQTQNGQTYVRVMKNGQISQATVEIGVASDTQTEIVSGVSEGDTVVTGTTTASSATRTATSVFSAFGGGGFNRGGAVRVTGR
jgi:RND family efflux transporter MFP subunit